MPAVDTKSILISFPFLTAFSKHALFIRFSICRQFYRIRAGYVRKAYLRKKTYLVFLLRKWMSAISFDLQYNVVGIYLTGVVFNGEWQYFATRVQLLVCGRTLPRRPITTHTRRCISRSIVQSIVHTLHKPFMRETSWMHNFIYCTLRSMSMGWL